MNEPSQHQSAPVPAPGPPPSAEHNDVSLVVGGGAIGLVLTVLGVIGDLIWVALLGVVIALVCVGGGLVSQHWREERRHQRGLEFQHLFNQPALWSSQSAVAGERYKADGSAGAQMLALTQELLKELLGQKEQARERAHQADQAERQRHHDAEQGQAARDIQRELETLRLETQKLIAEGDRTGDYQQLITRLEHEIELYETRMKYEKPDAEFEVNQRLIKLKGRLAEAEHINQMADGPQKEQAWRIWRSDL